MRKGILLLVLMMLMIFCSDRHKNETNDYIPILDYYNNGSLKSKGFVDPVSRDRKGNWEYYFQDGDIRAKGVYAKGYKISLWEYFRPYEKVYWMTYFDSTLSVELNVPGRYEVFSRYQGRNILAAFDSIARDSFQVNFNISKFCFNGGLDLRQKVQAITDNIPTNHHEASINGNEALVSQSQILVKNRIIFLSQCFIASKDCMYVINYFDLNSDPRLFYEISFSLKVR